MSAMGQSSDALIRLVASQPEIADQLAKWGQTEELSGIPLLSPQLLQDAWYGELSRHADTYGLKFANSIPYVHIWARAGTLLMLNTDSVHQSFSGLVFCHQKQLHHMEDQT